MRLCLLLLLPIACNRTADNGSDSNSNMDGGTAAGDGGSSNPDSGDGETGTDGGTTTTDGGSDGGGSDDGGTGDGGDDDGLVWEDVTPTDGPAECMGMLYRASTTAVSKDGLALVETELPAGRGFQVVARATDPEDEPLLYQAYGPDGLSVVAASYWWTQTELLSAGLFPMGEVGAFDWPVRAEDKPYVDGRWKLYLAVFDSTGNPVDGAGLNVDLYVTDDDNTEQGCLYARVVTATGVVADAGDDTIDQAVARWEEVYAAAGITLVATRETSGLSARLPQPASGDDIYETLAGEGAPHELVVVIGDSVEDSASILGQSGGVPGPLTAGPRTAVVTSWLLHAGTDAVLSSAEAEYLGETMAHEAGHYLGLFHPIDFDADFNVAYTDALDDTDTCSGGFEACGAVLGQNLMFPYAWCLSGGDCEPQDDLSIEQVGVLQRFPGVL